MGVSDCMDTTLNWTEHLSAPGRKGVQLTDLRQDVADALRHEVAGGRAHADETSERWDRAHDYGLSWSHGYNLEWNWASFGTGRKAVQLTSIFGMRSLAADGVSETSERWGSAYGLSWSHRYYIERNWASFSMGRKGVQPTCSKT